MGKREIKKDLLRKLYLRKIFHNKHTSFDNLPKGFPSHLAGEVKDVAKDLIKEKILLTKSTHYGLEVSLNHKKLKEIEDIISEE